MSDGGKTFAEIQGVEPPGKVLEMTLEEIRADISQLRTIDLIKISISESFQNLLLAKFAGKRGEGIYGASALDPLRRDHALVSLMNTLIDEAEAEIDRRIPIPTTAQQEPTS